MIDVHQKLLELAKKEYQIALQFCILNDSVSAMNWLKRSASKNYEPAISLIHELIDKNLIVQKKE